MGEPNTNRWTADLGVVSWEDVQRAKNVTLNYLASRPRTVRQVRERLVKAGVSEVVAGEVIEWAVGLCYLDDESFAHVWVKSRADRRNTSVRLLRSELLQQGVPVEVVDSVLAEQDLDADERRAQVFAETQVRKLARQGVEDSVVFRRTVAALTRRGFTSTLSVEVTRSVLEGLRGE